MLALRLSIGILLILNGAAPCNAEADSLADQGKALYRTAVRPDGSALQAVVQSDVALPPSAAACVNCHRRSGYGISEGGSRSLNLTATALFAASEKPPLRPAYDDATVARAIIGGIAADGRELHATMPRYELTAEDAAALTSYLRTLGAIQPHGVTDSEITIATVLSADAPEAERQAVERVMRRYIDLKNGESRRESERATASRRHFYGRSRQRAHRTWKLQTWELTGKPSRWNRQLQSHYSETKPFAIVSGTTGVNWRPVHEFCERVEVPCILPLSSAPNVDARDFYPLYFSAGANLEAAVTADHISRLTLADKPTVLVVHNGTDQGAAALTVLTENLGDKFKVSTLTLTKPNSRRIRRLQSQLRDAKPDVLVLWQPVATISELLEATQDEAVSRHVYSAQTWTDWLSAKTVSKNITSRLSHIYPYSLPSNSSAQFPREYLWLKQHSLSDLDIVAAAKVLYACRVLGVALADIQSNFSREYLLESLEHALDGTQLTSLFPRTSLGPNQRILSRGAYVVRLDGIEDGQFSNPQWLQP